MTRPQIIRADTIDLQDKSSPTAQDHSNQPEHPAPLGVGPAAPHQQASLQSVEDERNAEEAHLQNAWHNAGTSLSEDPGSDDERTVTITARHDNDDDMQDADDDDDMDDDMLDKISSSPSIDDGGYPLPSYPLVWPTRRDSLTPDSSPVIPGSASSSPFTTTPVHFPIPVAPSLSAHASDGLSFTSQHPFTAPPILLFSQHLSTSQSMEHHHGEYGTRTTDRPTTHDDDLSARMSQLRLVEHRLQHMREDSQGSLMSELDEEQARKMLRSVKPPSTNLLQDPFVEPAPQKPRSTNGTPPPIRHPEDEDDSWTTDSDADSWDEELDDDDASTDISFSDDPRFIDSGWGGECLRETEDIDFEFVYALHTFVATVEGQANATKGDTMVLLDDSNSYWWLVRVVKDSSIGYLPAEHIETPTERLARLNKHRNIDLSATMLGDTAEKAKNPLKKAMRRRNAKTVQFGAPTYVEASDYDYSSDEEGGELFGGPEPKQTQQQQQEQTAQKPEAEQDDSLEVKPLKLGGIKKVSSEESRSSSEEVAKDDEKSRTSDEMFDRPLDQKVSRNGTLRNTDSFFKDENTETRKITLTPNLLRDDSSTSTTGSRERGASLESLEKNGFADKVKDEKKKKDKKSGMLSGLFKRKDKKDKDSKSDIDIVEADLKKAVEKPEQTSPQAVNAKPAEVSPERQPEEQVVPTPSRQSSKGKLQKQQRARTDSPIKTKGILKTDSPMEAAANPEDEEADANEAGSAGQQAASTMRMVSPDQGAGLERQTSMEERVKSPEGRVKSPESQGVMAAISSKNPFRSNTTTDSAPKPEKVRKAKERVALDDFDSSADEGDDPFADPDARDKTGGQGATEPVGRLSESPVHVSVADAQPTARETVATRDQESDTQHLPGLTGDNSSADTSSRVSTPDLDAEAPDAVAGKLNVAAPRLGVSPSPTHLSPNANTIPPPARAAPVPLNVNTSPTVSSAPVSAESTSLPAWSDASLRNYLEDGSEIRDLLLMINDTTGVVPVTKDHPLMSGLYVEETKAAQNLSSELDRLLAGLMDNRMKRHGSGASKKSQLSQMSKASTTGGR